MQVNVRDTGPIPGSKRSLGGGHGNPLQYSCLENAMDRGAWRVTVHGVAKSQTWLKQQHLPVQTFPRDTHIKFLFWVALTEVGGEVSSSASHFLQGHALALMWSSRSSVNTDLESMFFFQVNGLSIRFFSSVFPMQNCKNTAVINEAIGIDMGHGRRSKCLAL